MSDNKYKLKSENVALPEIKTKDEIDTEEIEGLNVNDNQDIELDVSYETLAIPEIHIHRKKHA